MELKKLPYDLTVCKLSNTSDIDVDAEFYFIGKTDEELSLVCKTEDTPADTIERDDGWRAFRSSPPKVPCPNFYMYRGSFFLGNATKDNKKRKNVLSLIGRN